MANKTITLTQDEYNKVIMALANGTELPTAIIEKLNDTTRELVEDNVPKSPSIGPDWIDKNGYSGGGVTLSAERLLEYHAINIMQSYLNLGQPCLILGRSNTGFTVISQNITYRLIQEVSCDQSIDFGYFTDGKNFTRIR